MSKLAEYKALEARLAEQLKQLDALKNDDELKSEIEFEEKLRKLMAEYDVNLRSVIALLDPEASRGVTAVGRGGARRQRQVKIYKNPNTGEVVETKGGNHRVLKAWKEQYGAEAVDSWIQ